MNSLEYNWNHPRNRNVKNLAPNAQRQKFPDPFAGVFPSTSPDTLPHQTFPADFFVPQDILHTSVNQKASPLRTNASTPQSSSSRIGRGYFAFPPSTHIKDTDSQSECSHRCQDHDTDSIAAERSRTQERERAWTERQQRDASLRATRLELENSEATRGEFEWVQSGGVLRDAEGRRDKVRTEAIRAEIRLREEEKELMRRWEEYEGRWRALLNGKEPIRFQDIPWPQDESPDTERKREQPLFTVADLRAGKMEEFLLASLKVRTNTITRKERVRSSWLRWHPDKISAVLGRVVEEDVSAVQEGIGVVMMCLKGLQDGG